MPDTVTGIGALSQAAQTLAGVGAEVSPGGGFLLPNQPNIVDFGWFLTISVQIPVAALPVNSPWPQYALAQALQLTLVSGGLLYTLAVYNCATHVLFSIAPDEPGQNYFATARGGQGYGLIMPTTGLVAASSDQSTSATLSSPDWTKNMTPGQLDFYKTPWGRMYLSYIRSYGGSIVGVT